MDLTALVVACSLHVDDALLTSVAYAHSRGNPYVVTNVKLDVLVDQDEPALAPTSLPAARALMTRVLQAGGDPIIGLLPVRPAWAGEFGKTTIDLFDPCTNIAIASAKVSEFDHRCRRKAARSSAPSRRACTLDHYGASVGFPALRVVVLAALEGSRPWPEVLILPERSPAPIPSRSEMFFQLGHTERLLPLDSASPARVSLP